MSRIQLLVDTIWFHTDPDGREKETHSSLSQRRRIEWPKFVFDIARSKSAHAPLNHRVFRQDGRRYALSVLCIRLRRQFRLLEHKLRRIFRQVRRIPVHREQPPHLAT